MDPTLTAVALAAAVVLLLARVSPAAAHEGGPRLILEPNEINPGGVVLVRGEDLGLDESMQVSIVGDSGRADLALVTTDGEGHFTVAVEIPADVRVGTYAIESVTSSGAIVRSLVRVHGTPVGEQGIGAPPGQDEGFPAVLPGASSSPAAAPAAAPIASVAPVASAGSALRPLSDPTGTAGEIDLVPLVALAGAIGALGFLFWRTRRPSAIETGSADLP